jgi:hypothetical protein
MKRLFAAAGLLALGAAGGALAARASGPKPITQPTLSDLDWKELAPNMPVMTAESWKGAGGAHCSFTKFPKGFVAQSHWHTNDIYAIVLMGKWGSHAEGTPESLQGPAGYQVIPGGVKHETKCGDVGDCVIYECSPKAFDLKGLPPPAKK